MNGEALGTLSEKTLKWWQDEWKPKPFNGEISEENKRLRRALDASIHYR